MNSIFPETDMLNNPDVAIDYLGQCADACPVASEAITAHRREGTVETGKNVGIVAARCSLMNGGIQIDSQIICGASGDTLPVIINL